MAQLFSHRDSILAGGLLGTVCLAALLTAPRMGQLLLRQPSLLPAIFTGLLVWWISVSFVLWARHAQRRKTWLRRTSELAGLPELVRHASTPHRWDVLTDQLLQPWLRSRSGQHMAKVWREAGLGGSPHRYLLLLTAACLIGALVGLRIAGPLFGMVIAGVSGLGVTRWVEGRATAIRRRLAEQLPGALDSLAAGLAAGLSFPQAVSFTSQELPPPASTVFSWLDRRLALGFPLEPSLAAMQARFPDASLHLALDGMCLQRLFGGDLIRMLGESAALLRERAELDREVEAVTAQGRLSGLIIAALVPISAAILLLSNPRYIDVLFDTLAGQLLLVLAIALQLAGWFVISRLVRLRY